MFSRLNTISTKLWIPNLVLIFMVFSAFFFFLPRRQESFILKQQDAQLQILANTLALGVEISLNADDYSGLVQALELLKRQPNLKLGAIIIEEEEGVEQIFASYPEFLTKEEVEKAKELDYFKEGKFSTEIIKGRVFVATSKEVIQARVQEINRPFYVLVSIMFLITGAVLYIFTFQITKPIRFLLKATDQLSSGNYGLSFHSTNRKDELGKLLIKYKTLTENLFSERKKNEQLNKGLENKIKSRTQDLEETLNELEKSQFLTRSVINTALDAVITIDENGLVIEWNNKAVEIFGYDKVEVLGRPLTELIIPKKYTKLHNDGMKIFHRTGKGPVLRKSIEIDAITKDGRSIDVSLFITPIKIGETVIFSSFLRDITESKKIRHQIELQRQINQAILNSLPINISLKNKEGIYIFVNDFLKNSLGISNDEIIGKTDKEVHEPSQLNQLLISDKKAWEEGQTGIFEEKYFIKNEEKYILGGKFLIDTFEENEKTNYLLSFSFDISDRKKVELQLEKALKAKDDFLSTMSHEIRTPLHSIIGISELLSNTNVKKREKLIDTLVFSSKHLMGLINDILDFSKINSGKLKFDYQQLNLVHFLQETLTQFHSAAEAKGIDLILESPQALKEEIYFDELRLSQIVNNLLSNAIKFTDEGYVKLSCSIKNKSLRKATVQFIVKDTGAGIKKENLNRITEAFVQENSGISRKYGGTGLGLSIVDSLLKKCNSKLLLTSELGVGSSFSFEIEVKLGAPIQPANDTKTLNFDDFRLNLNVLYIEDLPHNQLLMKTILENWDISIELASSVKEGLAFSQQKKFDLILMDIQMPEIDGVRGFEIIRKKSKLNKDSPIVAFTANAEYSEVNYYKEVGFNDVLTKPISNKRLKQFLIENFHHKNE